MCVHNRVIFGCLAAYSSLVRPFLHSTLLPLTSYEGTPSRHPAGPSPAQTNSNSNQARVRLPITASLLRRIKSHLSNDPSAFLNILIWSACCVGFFGFLRCREFLIPDGQHFDANRHLSLADVTLDRSPVQWRFICSFWHQRETNSGRAPK